ncbi:Uncharacterised protein [Bordetella pertussis]|nr:Uncharacterised protein [Bordetella pertussis]
MTPVCQAATALTRAMPRVLCRCTVSAAPGKARWKVSHSCATWVG